MNRQIDRIILSAWLILVVFGVIAIYTASSTRIGGEFHVQNFYIKQIVWVALSSLLLFLILRVPWRIIEVAIVPGYIGVILLLIAVFFFREINGAHRWIRLGGLRIQPSELAKLISIIFCAKLLASKELTNFQKFIRAAGAFALPFLLVLLEPDLGTSLVFLVSMITILIVAEFPVLYILMLVSPVMSILLIFNLTFFIIWIVFLIIIYIRNKYSIFLTSVIVIVNTFVYLIVPVAWNSLKVYQQERILTFLNPARDPLGSGYQIIQAKIAVGSGGVLGKGFLSGTQKSLNFLPEKHTDFIFSVIGEEFGFIGSLFLILLYAVLLIRIARIIPGLRIREFQIASSGILAYLAFQIVINIGMNISMFPTTGLPLPFISYGGSNLLINSIAVAMILKFYLERKSLL